MKNKSDEFNELDDTDDIDENFSFQDNYYYDDNSSFDSKIDDYDYLEYSYNKVDRNSIDDTYDYDEEIDEDDYPEKNSNRNKIVKFILLIIILLLIIWIAGITIKSIKNNSKKVDKEEVRVIKTDSINYDAMFLKTKEAALKYYTEKELNTSIDKEKTLKLLKSLEYIEINSNDFDLERSYVKLTKSNASDTFNILILLVHNNEEKTKTYEVSNYSYCIDSYLCEKQNILGMEENQVQEETNNNNVVPNEERLSEWSLWSNYEKTSCDTKEVSCNKDDRNCLTEIRLSKQNEKVGTYNKEYNTSRFAFSLISRKKEIICNNNDYIKIDGTYYKIEKDSKYTVLGAIKKDTQSDYYNWRYDGRSSYNSPPSDNINTRYVYVGPDYSNCSNTCQSNPKYYYDKYKFTKTLKISKKPSTDCTNLVKKTIANYTIAKQEINITREEDKYDIVCYKSYRTRKIIKN